MIEFGRFTHRLPLVSCWVSGVKPAQNHRHLFGRTGEVLFDADGFPWSELRPEHTAAVQARLTVQYSASTANKMLAALRGVLKACWRLGLIESEQYYRARDVGSVRGYSLPKGRCLSAGELRALFEVCDDAAPAGRRDDRTGRLWDTAETRRAGPSCIFLTPRSPTNLRGRPARCRGRCITCSAACRAQPRYDNSEIRSPP